MRIARICLLVAAVVVAAWFVLGGRQADEENTVTALLANTSHLTAAQANHADDLLSSAGFLNPDRQVSLLRAEVALAAGHGLQAQRLIVQVTREEPDNLQAWVQLIHATGASGKFAGYAFINLALLDPRLVPKKH